jgi:hypothetical protein
MKKMSKRERKKERERERERGSCGPHAASSLPLIAHTIGF